MSTSCEVEAGEAAGRAWRTEEIPRTLRPKPFTSSVGPFGYACAPLYASEHVKQRTLGKELTGRRSILTSHLVHR
jgi:hypothetical protein